MAFASIVLWGAPVAGEGVWATAPVRAGPKQITKIAAGLRIKLPIFTVGYYSLEFGLWQAPKSGQRSLLGPF
jgi:hypothetical protein